MQKKALHMLPLLFISVLLFPLFVSQTAQAEAVPIRVGILGDSNSDEYRADDNRAGGTRYEATTLSWVELLAKYRDIDFGKWGNWGGVRRSGYEYNWSRSGATTQDMIADGQHTGLAAQIKAGEIDYAIIFIGLNDFHTWNGTYEAVYSGQLSDAQVQKKVDSIVADITLAVETLQAAGNARIILATFVDPGIAVDFLIPFPDADKRQRVSHAIEAINQQLEELATSHDLLLVDLSNFGSSLLSRVGLFGDIIVGGEGISAILHGDEPHHLQLGDSVGHSGTVGSGFLANLFISALNSYDLNIEPFTDDEILNNAGIKPKKPS